MLTNSANNTPGTLGAEEKQASYFTNAEAAANYLFMFTAASDKWALTSGSNTNKNVVYTDDAPSFTLGSTDATELIFAGASTDLSASFSLRGASNGSNNAYLAPASENCANKELTEVYVYKVIDDLADATAGYFIAGGKVLVAYSDAKSTGYNKARFVSLAEVAEYTDAQTKWVVEGGIVKLDADKENCQIADEDLTLSTEGKAVSFADNKLYIGGAEITSATGMTKEPDAGATDLTGAYC